MTKRPQWVFFLLIALAFVALLIARHIWFARPFDGAQWHNPALVQQGVRLKMADRLIARRTLIGKSRADVEAILGLPTTTDYFNDWDLVYWLGPERSFFSIDSEWLVLRLDDQGIVVENRIVRD